MNDIILGLLIAILLLQFVVYFMNLSALRRLAEKQQSTIYGVSHVWGSIKELREELKSKVLLPLIPHNQIMDVIKREDNGEEGLKNDE
tara:strand:+ start:675 stop:938 length:264 start_codon:yes stop_codon:yes gene_type:complete